jgi:hypothetical protein
MDVLFAADAAVRDAVPAVVQRHRSAGVLTWALLHSIEAEVLADVAATGKHGGFNRWMQHTSTTVLTITRFSGRSRGTVRDKQEARRQAPIATL